jgi:hypothetical protein
VDSPLPFPTFAGACERLKASGLPLSPRDWFCQPQPWTAHAEYIGALSLLAIGLILPGMILAMSGRRLTAFLPLVAAPWIGWSSFSSITWWQSGAWPQGALAISVVNAALVIAPVLAFVLVWRRTPEQFEARPPSIVAGAAAALPILAGSVAVIAVAGAVQASHIGTLGSEIGIDRMVPSAVCIGLFGVVLGPDRRWWPWALAPVSLLLSGGPSVALLIGPTGFVDWSPFGYAIPLAGIGLLGSAWRPVAQWLTPRLRRARTAPTPSREPGGRGRLFVAFNAVAVAVLLASAIMFIADPMPAHVVVQLPTYLGVRSAAQDLRTKLDLRQAIGAMDAYRALHGTYTGFDAREAADAEPSLAWIDGVRRADASDEPFLTISIVTATDSDARVAALSASGNAFCVERVAGGKLAYGTTTFVPRATQAVRQAIATCGATPWTAATVRPIPTATLCDHVGASGYLLCRMVQVFIVETLQRSSPTPTSESTSGRLNRSDSFTV